MNIGRNERCPCNSGKKYKHCCGSNIIAFTGNMSLVKPQANYRPAYAERMTREILNSDGLTSYKESIREYKDYCKSIPSGENVPDFETYRFVTNFTSDVVESVGSCLKNKTFYSEKEYNRYADKQYFYFQNQPVKRFLGLSPMAMMELICNPIDGDRPFVSIVDDFNENFLINVDVVKYVLFCLNAIDAEDCRFKATQKGFFNRKFIQDFYNAFLKGRAEYPSFPMREADVFLLCKIRLMLETQNYIIKEKGVFRILEKGKDILGRKNKQSLYLDLLNHYMCNVSWLYGTRFDPCNYFIQKSAPFLLYMLKKIGAKYLSQQDYALVYSKAFPHYAFDVQFNAIFFGDVELNLKTLFFDNFCTLFGLVESREQPGQDGERFKNMDYRQSPLFKVVFGWNTGAGDKVKSWKAFRRFLG